MRYAILSTLCVAVSKYQDVREGSEFLVNRKIVEHIRTYVRLLDPVCQKIKSKELNPDEADVYSSLTICHISWLMHEFDLGTRIVNLVSVPDIHVTPFWREYRHAVCLLLSKNVYNWSEMRMRGKLKGQERYWKYYLDWISDITNKRDYGETVTSIKEAFRKRNQDKRIKDDNFRVDGSPFWTVNWDYRFESIQVYANENYV